LTYSQALTIFINLALVRVAKKKEAREQQQVVSDIGIGFFMDRGNTTKKNLLRGV
jgi:hypothetical protein